MNLFLLLVLFSFILFINALYYSLMLLVYVLIIMSYLVSTLNLSSLTILIFFIIYIGAMMVLIGYVCAICPNILVRFTLNTPSSLSLISFFLFIIFSELQFTLNTPSSLSLISFFYSSTGLFIFIFVILMLFFVLLMVTTHYSNSKGPFRSLS